MSIMYQIFCTFLCMCIYVPIIHAMKSSQKPYIHGLLKNYLQTPVQVYINEKYYTKVEPGGQIAIPTDKFFVEFYDKEYYSIPCAGLGYFCTYICPYTPGRQQVESDELRVEIETYHRIQYSLFYGHLQKDRKLFFQNNLDILEQYNKKQDDI